MPSSPLLKKIDTMKKIALLTSSRADYGILTINLKLTKQSGNFELLITGSHLSNEFGNTIDEIKAGLNVIENLKSC